MSCRCWECRKRRGLAAIAPRLTAAYRRWVAEIPARAEARADLLKARRLVAHRELQYLRAGRSHSSRYVAERNGKLKEAQGYLTRCERRLEALL